MIVLYIIGGLLALIILLLCIPVGLSISYDQSLGLTVKYLFIPFKILPRKEKKPAEEKTPKNAFERFLARLSVWRDRCRSFFAREWKRCRIALRKARVWIKKRVYTIRVKLFGKPKKKASSSAQPQKKRKGAFSSLIKQRGFFGAIELLIQVTKLSSGTVGRVYRGMRINRLVLRAKIGGEDAAKAAINYGMWCSVLFPMITTLLEHARGRKKRDVRIDPDFTSAENSMNILIDASVLPILAVWHLLTAFTKLLFREIKQQVSESMRQAVSTANAANVK